MKARTEMSESTGRQVGRRRALLWLSGLGGLLGLGSRAKPASAATGDPIRAGQVTTATGETSLLSTPDAQPDILFRVRGRDPGGDAIHAQGAGTAACDGPGLPFGLG